MTFGCGNYKCKDCYPFQYGCEFCGETFPSPVPNGSTFQCECGWITNREQENKTMSEETSDFATQLEELIQKERNRIADGLLEHNKVCNYKAVTEEECDVCHYLSQAAKLIRTGEVN